MKFEVVTRTKNGPTHYLGRIVAANGEELFSTQKYSRKESAKHACELVRDYAKTAEIVEVTE
jgi:uncharacterized protein YegP (UPF0339 family)